MIRFCKYSTAQCVYSPESVYIDSYELEESICSLSIAAYTGAEGGDGLRRSSDFGVVSHYRSSALACELSFFGACFLSLSRR